MDFSTSISRKHPAESTNFATPQKRRRTTVVHTPIPQNARCAMLDKSQNSSFTSTSSAEGGIPSTAPRLRMNAPITPNQHRTTTSGMGAPNTIGGDRMKLLEPRSFAPRPLQSPFAARSMRNKRTADSTSRFLTQLRKQQTEAAARSFAKADYSTPIAMPQSENKSLSKGLADSVNGSRVATSSAAAAQTPAPARRIHNPNFRSERKQSPRPPGLSTIYHFGSSTNTSHIPFTGLRAQDPAASSPSAPESRLASLSSKPTSGETAVRADGIISFLASSIEKAKQALAGNRADRNEERKEKEKEAIRKKMEEEQRIKRDEIFKEEMQREKDEMERREREEHVPISHPEPMGQNMGRDWVPAGVPSFMTEDTIVDSVDYTPNGYHEATFMEDESTQIPQTTTSPTVRFKDMLEEPIPQAQGINYHGRETSSEESEEEEEEEDEIPKLISKEKLKPMEVICIDSSSEDGDEEEVVEGAEVEEEEEEEEDEEEEDEDEGEDDEDETLSLNSAPKFLFGHPRKLAGSEDLEGEDAEEVEYEEYDEEEVAEYDHEDDGKEVTPRSNFKSREFIDADEAEEIIEQFGDEPEDSADDEEKEPSYVEEETERDETDNEGYADHSLDSIMPQTQNNTAEAAIISPSQPNIALVSPHYAEDGNQPSPPRSVTPTPTSPAGIVIIDDDASDGELQHDAKDHQPQLHPHRWAPYIEEPARADDTGIYRNDSVDVFNRYDKHIGEVDDDGYVYADVDDKAIGFISAEGVFHRLSEDSTQNTRGLTDSELTGKSKVYSSEYEDEGALNEEEGDDEIEVDFKKALEEEEEEDAEAEDDTELERQETLREEVVEPEPRTAANDEPLIEEEENIGIDLHENEEGSVSVSREVVFTPAKEVEGPIFRKEQPSTPKTPYRLMSNDELSRSLRLNKDGALVVKEATPEPESEDEIQVSQVFENKNELGGKVEVPLIDSSLPETQAPATTSEKEEEAVPASPASPVVDVEVTVQAEIEVEVAIQAEVEVEVETEVEPENEKDEEADTTMQTCAEEGDEADTTMQTCLEEVSIHSESIIIVERDDGSEHSEVEDEGEPSPTLLPDSFHDRPPMFRELREATVEEQIIEWQQGDQKESRHRYTIREEDEESCSEVEEGDTVKEKAPVGDSVEEQPEEEEKTDAEDGDTIMSSYPGITSQPIFGFMPPTAPSSFDTKLATAPLFSFKPPSISTSEAVGERLATAPLYSFTPPSSSPSESSSSIDKLPTTPLLGLNTFATSTQPSSDKLPTAPVSGFKPSAAVGANISDGEKVEYPTLPNKPTFEFKPSTAPSSFTGEKLAHAPIHGFKPPVASWSFVGGEKLASAPVHGFKPPAAPSASASGEKLASAPVHGFKPPTPLLTSASGEKLASAPVHGFKPPTSTPSEPTGEKLATKPLFDFQSPIIMKADASAEPAEKVEYPTVASKPLLEFKPPTAPFAAREKLASTPVSGFKPPTATSSFTPGEKLASAPLFGFRPPASSPAPVADVTVADARVDAETVGDSSEGEANITVDLGLGEDDVAVVLGKEEEHGAEEEQDKENKEERSVEEAQGQEPVEVTEDDEMGEENTSASERETTATPPPSEAINKKRKRTGKTSDVPVEERQDIEMVDELAHSPAPKAKRGRAVRASKRTAAKKRKGDTNFVPHGESENDEDMEVKEPEVKKRRTTRKKTSSVGTAKEDKEPYLEDEKLEEELKIVETAVATALDPDIPPKKTVELPDGSEVPAIQPEEAEISLGKELRDGKVIEPSLPPRRATRKRAREASVEAADRTSKTTRSVTKKAASIKEASPEPEVAEINVEEEKEQALEEEPEPLPKTKKKTAAPDAPRRGRSASVEPLHSIEERPIKAARARKTPSVKEASVEPEEQPTTRFPRSKRTPSVRGGSVEPEAAGDMDIITLRNRKVVVNRQGSVDLSADETDRSTNTIRRSSRTRKGAAASATSAAPADAPSPPAKENIPVTPKAKRARKPPVMSAIKEADVEASVKKTTARRSKRKET